MTYLNRSVAAAALVAMCVVPRVSGQTQTQPPVFRARADVVTLGVAVHQRGRPVTGLQMSDFEVLDGGVLQQITRMEYETLPIDLTLLLDVSESVSGSILDNLRRSIRDLVRDLTPNDRFALVTFNVRISRALGIEQGRGTLDSVLNSLRAFGGTSIRDALAVTLTRPEIPGRRQLIIAFTDGEDQSSITDAGKLFDVVRHTTPTVGLVFPSFGSQPGTSARMYEELAAETGGFVDFARPDRSLSGSFRRLLDDFRKSYLLYFTPSGRPAPGVRPLEVRVKREGVEVRTRRSYAVY